MTLNKSELINKIAEKDFELDNFVGLALEKKDIKAGIVKQMLVNPDIMVYYHCYYLVAKGSKKTRIFIIHIGMR